MQRRGRWERFTRRLLERDAREPGPEQVNSLSLRRFKRERALAVFRFAHPEATRRADEVRLAGGWSPLPPSPEWGSVRQWEQAMGFYRRMLESWALEQDIERRR